MIFFIHICINISIHTHIYLCLILKSMSVIESTSGLIISTAYLQLISLDTRGKISEKDYTTDN